MEGDKLKVISGNGRTDWGWVGGGSLERGRGGVTGF